MIQSCKLATHARVKKIIFFRLSFSGIQWCIAYLLSFIHFSEHFHAEKRLNGQGFLKKRKNYSTGGQCKKRRAIQETMDPRIADKDRVFDAGQRVLLWITWLVILRCFASVWSWRAWIASICARSFKTNKHNIYWTVRYKVKEKSHTLISEKIARKGKHTPLYNLDFKLNVKIP